ncbi:MAG: spermidine synthase [Roseiflexaceae bacterium]|nr:spermidine synthase [Roseiflexaceae bacterium]
MNDHALATRLAPLLALPDGTLEEVSSPLHRIRIVKHGSQIHFYFVGPGGRLDGPMSRIDLRRPLHLLAEYTQFAMPALLWQPTPQRACLIGLAGGRISLVLRHALRDLVIDNVEIDPAAGPLAERFFGLEFDSHQRLIVADAWAHMLASMEQYDFIVMDAFSDSREELDQLATPSFYHDCSARLATGGVMVANLLASDPRYQEKITAFAESFPHPLLGPRRGGAVLFGCEAALNAEGLRQRAAEIQAQHVFDFPYIELAARLQPLVGVV